MAYSATCCLHMGPLQLHAPVSTVILLLASVLVVGSSAREAPSSSVYSFELIHAVDTNNGSGGFTSRDDELARSADDDTYLDTASYSQQEYLMELKIGTPPTSFKAVVDTGSEVIWTKRTELCSSSAKSRFASMACPRNGRAPDNKYCNQCSKDGQCVFFKRYGSKKRVAEGLMARDMLTLSRMGGGPEKVPISFGCASRCHQDERNIDCHRLIPTSADGILGLNRGPNSLLTQLGATKFSYCLSDPLKPEQSSPLWFGGGDLKLRSPRWWSFWEAIVQTTPLVKIPDMPYKYYIRLEGISVGNAPWVKVPKEGADFNHKSYNGLMFVDSGCSSSRLASAAFDVLVDLLKTHLHASRSEKKNSRACFGANASTASRPDVALHFSGGAAMRLPWSTYMLVPKDGASEFCTAITNHDGDISILGNLQQQNMHMLFDLQEGSEKLSFVPVPDCSEHKL